MSITLINKKPTSAEYFAFDGCHKIYLLELEGDAEQAAGFGYGIYPIAELENAWRASCGLRFIANWAGVDDRAPYVRYAAQGGKANIVFSEEQTQ